MLINKSGPIKSVAMFSFFLASAVLLLISITTIGMAETKKGGEASDRPTNIRIYSNPTGHSGYVLSFALADMISKYSPNLEASCVESKGSSANILHLQQNPEAEKNTIVFINPYAKVQAKKADPPFMEPYKGLRYIALAFRPVLGMVSINPDINEVQDLAGKRIGVGPKGVTLEYLTRYVLDYGYNIWDKLGGVSYLGFGAVTDAILDGTVDAGIMSLIALEKGGEWLTIPASEQLLNTKECYFISFSEEAIAKARKKSGYPLYPLSVKPKQYGKTEAQPYTGFVFSNAWAVHKSMDNDIVRQICKVMYNHADEFAEHHVSGKGIKPSTLPDVSAEPGEFHPAARKFYEDKGLTVGLADQK